VKEKPLSRSPQKKADLFQTYNGKVWDESERNFSFGRKKSPSRTLLKRKPIFLYIYGKVLKKARGTFLSGERKVPLALSSKESQSFYTFTERY